MSGQQPKSLAPYAATLDQHRGRVHDQPDDPWRDPFEADRHRVLTSAAFRRLEYKTQAFVTLVDDHYRTRLTHTLEVASIARTLAIALNVNATLAEVIALAHDLGHPPFGHAGEVTLRDLMSEHGGFEHNMHSLRVVDYLEHPYPSFRGLNLTYETREGLVKHATRYDKPDTSHRDPQLWDLLESGPQCGVEGQIANIADRLAYDCHDLEDAIAAGMVRRDALDDVDIWREVSQPVIARFGGDVLAAIRRPILDALLQRLIDDIIGETRRRIEAVSPALIDDIRNADDPVVTMTDTLGAKLGELETFLIEQVYRHHRIVRMDAKARRFITRLFDAYVENPNMLPPRFAKRIDEQGTYRVVCDYIAGMTDRYCQDEYSRLFEPFERV